MSPLSLFPVTRPDLYEEFEIQLSGFWHMHEIDMSREREDFLKLDAGQQRFISHILGFFAVSDQLVIENLVNNFMADVSDPSAKLCFAFQQAMEAIHQVTYNLLLDTTIPDPVEKQRLFEADESIPVVRQKLAWVRKFMDKKKSFAIRLLAFMCLEGIFFSGAFCSVYYVQTMGLMPGLCFANAKIQIDENSHCRVGVKLFNGLSDKPDRAQIIEVIDEAVELERQFICDAIPCALLGMNQDMMSEYIRYIADYWLGQIGQEPFYNAKQPFGFMEAISMERKENFFEGRVSAYQLSTDRGEFGVDEDF